MKSRLFALVSLFNGISTFVGYLMQKESFKQNSSDSICSIAGKKRSSYLSLVNVIVINFELTYFEGEIQHFSHYWVER